MTAKKTMRVDKKLVELHGLYEKHTLTPTGVELSWEFNQIDRLMVCHCGGYFEVACEGRRFTLGNSLLASYMGALLRASRKTPYRKALANYLRKVCDTKVWEKIKNEEANL